jgi:hypothetical protein
MKTKLTVILAMAVLVLSVSQSQAQQPIHHYGYIGPTTDDDLLRVRSYTDFTYVDGVYGLPITDLATRVKNNGMRSLIDLGRVLWCPEQSMPLSSDLWHLCGRQGREVDYISRWYSWVSMNSSVLNSNYVLAFSVMTEHTKRQVPTADVEAAIALVKQSFPQIPTLVSEGTVDVFDPAFAVPNNADWIALAAYCTHPNLDQSITNAVGIIKSKKQYWQHTAYTLDGFHTSLHDDAGITINDMDTIAQEWYTFASRDLEAILIGVFLWYQAPDTGGIGSKDFPQHVLDKHAAIGAAIFAGRYPTYQGYVDNINLSGWAWDTSQPNTPISVDVYDGGIKIATVRADQYRQDLVNAGIGNGRHGFLLPASVCTFGRGHWVAVKYSGLNEVLSNSPQWIYCGP